jgi:ABC-type antimicrobial peptide transport system permease subunit
MAMFTRRITSALFAIAIASSLITASSLVGSALAKKEKDGQTNTITDPNGTDVSSTPKSQSANVGGSSGTTDDTGGVSAKDLKSLSKCQSGAAKDGDLTLAEVKDCYSQVFG